MGVIRSYCNCCERDIFVAVQIHDGREKPGAGLHEKHLSRWRHDRLIRNIKGICILLPRTHERELFSAGQYLHHGDHRVHQFASVAAPRLLPAVHASTAVHSPYEEGQRGHGGGDYVERVLRAGLPSTHGVEQRRRSVFIQRLLHPGVCGVYIRVVVHRIIFKRVHGIHS